MALTAAEKRLVDIAKNGTIDEFVNAYGGDPTTAGRMRNAYAVIDDKESMGSRYSSSYGGRGGYSRPFGGGSTGGGKKEDQGSFLGKTVNFASDIIQAGTTTMGNQMNFQEFFTFSDLLGVAIDENSNKFRGWGNIIRDVANFAGNQILQYLQQQSQLVSTINEKTGMTGEFSKNFREEISESVPYALRLGISFDQITKAVASMVADSGRFKILSTETINKITLMSKVYFDSLEEAGKSLESFQKVSMGAYDAMGAIERIGKSSLEVGLNAKETTKIVVTNLDKLNQYGFKQGIDGLGKMAQQAQSLRMSLDGALTIAEKVMDPTQALALSAELQVVGGAIGDFNDPLKMMWMATNDVQGLQDALVESAESLASFNEESGRFEIVGADLRRLRAMQDATGVSAKELSEIAIQSAQRTAAALDIDTSGLRVSDEDKEFLTNIAQMREGRMVIEVPKSLREQLGLRQDETTMALEDMDQGIVEALLRQREEFEKLSTEDIARQQVSLLDNIGRDVSYLAGSVRQRMGGSIEDVMKTIGFSPSEAMKESKKITDMAVEASSSGIKKAGEFLVEGVNVVKKYMEGKEPVEPTTEGTTTTNTGQTGGTTTGNQTGTATGAQTGYVQPYTFKDNYTPLSLNLEGTQKGLTNVGNVVKELQENVDKYKDKTTVTELINALTEIKKDEKTYGKDNEYLINILADYLSTTEKTGKEKSDLLKLLAEQQSIVNKTLPTEVKSIKPEEQKNQPPVEEIIRKLNEDQKQILVNFFKEYDPNKPREIPQEIKDIINYPQKLNVEGWNELSASMKEAFMKIEGSSNKTTIGQLNKTESGQQSIVPTEKEKTTEVAVKPTSNIVRVENFDYLLNNTKKTSDVLEVTSRDKKQPTLVVRENPLMSNSIKELNSNITKEKDKKRTELKPKEEEKTKNVEQSENDKVLKDLKTTFVNSINENDKKINVVSGVAESTINEVGNVFEKGILSANNILSGQQKTIDDVSNVISTNQKVQLDNVLKTTNDTIDSFGKQYALLGNNISPIKLPEGELQMRKEEPKATTKEEKGTTVTENKKIEIRVTSDVNSDKIKRVMTEDPTFAENINSAWQRTFLENPFGNNA